MTKTSFHSAEETFWHSVGVHALFFPLSRWVQPPNNGGGADTSDSKRRLVNLMDTSGLSKQLRRPEAVPATTEDLLRVHGKAYLDAFKKASDAGGGELGTFAPFSVGGYEIAALSAGLALQAVDDVMSGASRNAYALCRPAGHHCLPNEPMGFCLLANIPIAIEHAIAKRGLKRVAVVDWDVHHGNGTQSIFYDRSDVLTISIHQENCFPPGYTGEQDVGTGAGTGFNCNIPLPAGSGHQTYIEAMEKIVVARLEAFKPELIIVASGLDASAVDPLARQLLTSESYRAMTRIMMTSADKLCKGRLAVVHEGGYSEAYVPFCGHRIIEQLSGVKTEVEDPELEFFSSWQPSPKVQAFQSQFVDDLRRLLVV
ncbi:MAG: class II histone deacetylase [Steroidobacteraceae bacterium]